MARPRKGTGLPPKEQKHAPNCMKTQSFENGPIYPAPPSLKTNSLVIIPSSPRQTWLCLLACAGRWWESRPLVLALHKVLQQLFQCLAAKGGFHLPPQLETVTPTARSWCSAPFYCADFSVWSQPPPAERQWHSPPSAGTRWGQAGEHGFRCGHRYLTHPPCPGFLH